MDESAVKTRVEQVWFLTVAIPTYNRPQKIVKRLEEIAPQLLVGEELLVIDNASDGYESLYEAERSWQSLGRLRIIKNALNIGGDANICRCIECSLGEYVWVVGDDDEIEIDALERIRNQIHANPAACWLNFADPEWVIPARPLAGKKLFGCRSIGEVEDFSNLLFISNNLYKGEAVRKQIRTAMQFAYCHASQVAVGLAAIGDEGEWVLCHPNLVRRCEIEETDKWEPFLVLLGLPILADLPELSQWRKDTLNLIKKNSSYKIANLMRLSIRQYQKGITKILPAEAFRILMERTGRGSNVFLGILVLAARFGAILAQWIKKPTTGELEIAKAQLKR